LRTLAASGAGFLLAVLWLDLMFDVQLLGRQGRRKEVVASISAYYRRVTTDARPMNRLVALAMVVTLASIVTELARGTTPTWAWWTCLVLTGVPVALAGGHTVPSAVRLGAGGDDQGRQLALARSILRDHLVCLVCIVGLLGLLLGAF
jgi:hypothetical protein